MKKKLSFLFAALLCAVMSFATNFTLTSADEVTQDGITISFATGNGSTAPTWKDAGLRLYQNNTITISAETDITAISFDWEKQGNKTFASVTANVGSYTHPSAAGKGEWKGSAKSVVFTLSSGQQLQLNTLSVTVTAPVSAQSIKLNKATLSLDEGTDEQLEATFEPEGATADIQWTTDNAEAATVKDGLVTAVGVGEATITATITADGAPVAATCKVTVTAAVAVESVALDQQTLTIEATKTSTLTATVSPTNATNKNVVWTTSDAKTATVKDGVVTGVATGNADITVTTEDGKKTAVCKVTVTTLSGMDYSVNLGTAAGYNTWTVDNKSIGSLPSVWSLDASNGYAKASAYVSKTNNAAEAWLVSPVLNLSEAEVATMTINHALNFLNKNACPLKIMGTKNGTDWVELAISEWPAGTSWTFEEATVDLTSVISASTQVALAYISTTTVAPTWEIKTVAIKGTKAVHATGITLDNNTLSLEQYKRGQLTATLTPKEATDAVAWTTTDAKVATVSATGEVTAAGVGEAKIVATVTPAEGKSYTAECAVTVTAATPITVAKAVEVAKTVTTNNEAAAGGMYVIRGYVTDIAAAYSGTNMTVWMADTKDGGNVFEAYKVIPVAEADQDVAVGDLVEVIGDITKFYSTYETVAGGSLSIVKKAAYTVTLLADAENGGTVEGDGEYTRGTEAAISATANTGYKFVNWTDAEGEEVSDVAEYRFTVTGDVTYTANFQEEAPAKKTFTIEKLWESVDIPAAANCKQGAGWDGVVYVQDKTENAAKVYAITKDGKTEYASSGVGQGMAIDDAGNMIVRDAYFAASAPGSFLIYKKGETTGKQVTFTLNPTGRTDFNSASGNIFSAEGGYVYFYCNAATTISYVKITNGAATAEDVTVGTIGTGWTAGSSLGHVMCDRDGNIVAQPRSADWKKWDVTAEKFVTFSLPQVKNSTLGGCTFELGGKEFWAYNIKGTNYNSEWNLYNMTDAEFVSETTLYVKDKTTTNTAYANWLNAQKIDEKTVYIYQFCPNVGAAVWKVSFNDSTPTEIEDITPSEAAAPKAVKVLRNGQVLIVVGDKTYNVMGQVVE